MQVILDSDLFIPVMYTDSDMGIVVHVHANVIISKCTQYRLGVGIFIHSTG